MQMVLEEHKLVTIPCMLTETISSCDIYRYMISEGLCANGFISLFDDYPNMHHYKVTK